MKKTRILFVCTGNACRSQMAEGWARHLKPDTIDAASAGTNPAGLSSRTVRVMGEAGVDISGQRSKHVDKFTDREFDYVVTLCGGAHESCPVFPSGTRVVHRGFDDPAAAAGSREEVLEVFRRVRDEIRDFVKTLPGALDTPESQK